MREKQKRKELIIIICSLGLIIASLVYTFLPLNIEVVNTKLPDDNIIDLFFTLFEVQATIAVLSISIIAIITGFQSESIHGISITHYVTTLKPYILKHKYLMIADLIITGINYLLVSFRLFNTSVAVFIVSILISCVLICDTSFVFKKKTLINKEIDSFFIEECNEEYINDLGLTINRYASAENVSELKTELSFLNSVFKDQVNRVCRSEDSLGLIEEILVNCFLNTYLSNNKEMVLDILKTINDIYKSANDCENNYPVDIWSSIYIEYFAFLRTISEAQVHNYKKFDYIDFKYQMQKNQIYKIEEEKEIPINNYGLEYYYTFIYRCFIIENRRINDEHGSIKKRIFQNAYFEIPVKENNSPTIVNRVKGLCYLIKELIEIGEIDFLEKEYLRHEKYHLNNIKSAFIFLVSVIYSYYLAFYEPIVNEKTEQQNAIAFLDYVKKSFREMIYYIDIIEVLKYSDKCFCGFMHNWEKFEDRVMKTVCLEPTIQRFLFFLCIEKYYDEKSLSNCFRLISNNNVQTLLTKYFEDEKIFDEQYKLFQKEVFNRDKTPRLNIVKNIVKSALTREYKNELVEQSNTSCINSETIIEYEKKLKEHSDKVLERFSLFYHEGFGEKKTKSYMKIISSVDEYDLKNNEISEYIEKSIILEFYRAFFDSFNSHINVKEVKYESKNKQDTLIELASSLNVNTYFGNQETFWDEDVKDKLIKFCENYNKIENPFNRSEIYLLNSNGIYFTISNVSFAFEDYTIDSLSELNVDIKDDVYYYSRYSNIPKAPFNKKELFEYLGKMKKRLIMSFDVNYAVKEETIGCGINILFD